MATIYRDTTQAYDVSTDNYKELGEDQATDRVMSWLDPLNTTWKTIFGSINKNRKYNLLSQESEQNYLLSSDSLYGGQNTSKIIIIIVAIVFLGILLVKKKNGKK